MLQARHIHSPQREKSATEDILPFRIEGDIKNSSDKQKVKEYSNTKGNTEKSSLNRKAVRIYRKEKIIIGK